jgi:hypothetical protein
LAAKKILIYTLIALQSLFLETCGESMVNGEYWRSEGRVMRQPLQPLSHQQAQTCVPLKRSFGYA